MGLKVKDNFGKSAPDGGGAPSKDYTLVLVEAPGKVKKIQGILNKIEKKKYKVLPTIGHCIDLPAKKFGINLETMEAEYEVMKGKSRVLSDIKKAVKKAKRILVATDADREGEMIGYSIIDHLSPSQPTERISFQQITQKAIEKAIGEPREFDMSMVYAQKARRFLDRIVGYRISPILWKTVRKGLSAGRVQSAALKIIVEREVERENFKPEQWWTVTCQLKIGNDVVEAIVTKKDGKKVKFETEEEAKEALKTLKKASFKITDIISKQKQNKPYAPFTTSTFQQACAGVLNMSAKQAMSIAQQLYQSGMITYHRSDSTTIAEEGVCEIRNLIQNEYGGDYLPSKAITYKTKQANAQEAHECIRPVHFDQTPPTPHHQRRVYELIQHRAVACQMNPYISESTTAVVEAAEYELEIKGTVIVFDGWLKEYPYTNRKDVVLPSSLKKGEELSLQKAKDKKHETQPPPRFTNASIIKALEESGIGRPSTYASIIDVLTKRDYVLLERKQFAPTELGRAVKDQLDESFPRIVDIKFTATVEEGLDKISRGEYDHIEYLNKFWKYFSKQLEKTKVDISEPKESEHKCPKCGKNLVERVSKYGKFLACRDKECKVTKSLNKDGSLYDKEKDKVVYGPCPKDSCSGELVLKRSRFGSFFGCSNYPDCREMLDAQGNPIVKKKVEEIGEECPQCKKPLVMRNGRRGKFVACSGFPRCRYTRRQVKDDDKK